jgi:type 1 glutamine amidotransferase
MRSTISRGALAAACAAVALAAGAVVPAAQAPPAQGRGGGGGGGRGAGAASFFLAVDGDKDGAVTRAEMKSAFERWFGEWDSAKAGSLAQDQLTTGLNAALPPAPPAAAPAAQGPECGGRSSNPQTVCPQDVTAMMAALPDKAPAKPKQARRVLVLGRAAGFVHSSIPLAARTIEEMGKKTGAWTATTTYNAADINEQNLKQYDAIFLSSTTGHFLDDPADSAATEARRKALLDFVRSGKGLAGIHAASDSYHRSSAAVAPGAGQGAGPGGGRGRGGGRGGGGQAGPIVAQLLAQGDKNSDQRLSREEFSALADAWYDRMDTAKGGRVSQAEFPARFAALWPAPAAAPTPVPPRPGCTGPSNQGPATQTGPDNQIGTWPEFNKMIGGFFKFHWNDGQEITYKIDEPNHPLNAPFKKVKGPVVVFDETYTFGRDTYSRQNVRVLTSVDYSKMCEEDKKKEQSPRADGDYALSWIKRDGKGRVFYMAHGHNEKVYAIPSMMEHLLYGMQYALGDLQADDSPSVKGGTR